MVASLAAVTVAGAAGVGTVALLWPRRVPLPMLAWMALAGLTGPCIAGTAWMLLGLMGGQRLAVPLLSAMALGIAAVGGRRWRSLPAPPTTAGAGWLALALLIAIAWSSAVAMRTHLGWDGTVVWFHKARVMAASGGVMPAAMLADRTRAWSAPDYPLHVPAAMGWVLRWQSVEDERHLKVLPAAWFAAVLCLVAAAVRERAREALWPAARAAAAVLVLVTAPRLLVGEGSLASGYADGPLAGLYAALLWVAWRSDWGRDPAWQALLVVLAACLAWTKQEGVLAVAATAAACAWQQRTWGAMRFAWPALALAVAWQLVATAAGAVPGMAYGFAGVGTSLSRIPIVARGYAAEWGDLRTWGVFWPVLTILAARRRAADGWAALAVLAFTTGCGAIGFLFSTWPDASAHVAVTAGRQLIQVAPALVVVAFGADNPSRAA